MFRKSLLIIRDEKWLLRLPRQTVGIRHLSLTSSVLGRPFNLSTVTGLKHHSLANHQPHGTLSTESDMTSETASTIERALISRFDIGMNWWRWVSDGNDFGQYSGRSTPGGSIASWTVDHELISNSQSQILNLFKALWTCPNREWKSSRVERADRINIWRLYLDR